MLPFEQIFLLHTDHTPFLEDWYQYVRDLEIIYNHPEVFAPEPYRVFLIKLYSKPAIAPNISRELFYIKHL